MSNDRVARLRRAEQLARQGRLDDSIAEYRQLLDEQPKDWTAANLLGDVLARSGQVPEAVRLVARAAEILAADGFAARAGALYRKVLKLQPDSDAALVRAGELSALQGLIADARADFEAASRLRSGRGDTRGALEVAVRLGALDREDATARMDGARARLALDDLAGALREYTELGLDMLESGRGPEALAALSQVVALDRSNTTVAFVVDLLAAGRVADAAAFVALGALPDEGPAIELIDLNEPEAQTEPAAPLHAEAPTAEAADAGTPKADDAAGRAAPAAEPAAGDADIEEVFARLRRDAAVGAADAAGHVAYLRGVALVDAGDDTAAVAELRIAARSPQHRFAAARRLAAVFEARRQLDEAVDWLGRALDAPGVGDSDRWEALLRLATLLEQQGEPARALAACLELHAGAGPYGDVDARIARLTRAQAGG